MDAQGLYELASFISNVSKEEVKELTLKKITVNDELDAKVALAKYQMFLSITNFYLGKVKEYAMKEALKLDKNQMNVAKATILEANNIVRKATDNYNAAINSITNN